MNGLSFKKSLLFLLLLLSPLAGCTTDEGQGDSPTQRTAVRIASMRGPTTMGMVKLMDNADKGEAKHDYSFTMTGTADEIVALLSKGEIDVAAISCNVAAALYQRLEGQVKVAAINTLGVLYVVETGESIESVKDLAGKTVYATGKGMTPEYVFNYILAANGLDPNSDLTVEYRSEAAEVTALMAQNVASIAVLPQPFVITAQESNDALRVALDLTQEWEETLEHPSKSALVTGVILVRNAFLEEHKAAFDEFLEEYRASVEFVNANTEEAAKLIAALEIAPEEVAKKAIPLCNIVYIDGDEMQDKVAGYLGVLYGQNPDSVGGALPDEAFYYKK